MRPGRPVLLIIFVLSLIGCVRAQTGSSKTPNKVRGIAGRVLDPSGLMIDANDDSRLDNLIEGYKLMPVMIKNLSLRPIPMDVDKDRWVIVNEKGKKYQVVNSLRIQNPKIWRRLPDRMRTMIDYPEAIPINYSVTFDLLLPKEAQLTYFKEIRYYNATLRQRFEIEKEY